MSVEYFKETFANRGSPVGIWNNELLMAWFGAACPPVVLKETRVERFISAYRSFYRTAPVLADYQLEAVHESRIDPKMEYISTGAAATSLASRILPTTIPFYLHKIIRHPLYSLPSGIPLTYALVFALLTSVKSSWLTGRTQTIFSTNTATAFATKAYFFLSVERGDGRPCLMWIPKRLIAKVLNCILDVMVKPPRWYLQNEPASDLYLFKRIDNKYLPSYTQVLECVQS